MAGKTEMIEKKMEAL